MKFQVGIGEEFEISHVEIDEIDEVKLAQANAELKKVEKDLKETSNRNIVTYVLLTLVVIFLLGSAVLGFYDGNFDKLQAVYNIAAVPMSAILAYYFGEKERAKRDQL
jgi:hypothetical protein